MYQISEFSYLCKATLKTLRHYHKIGLLVPKKIDEFTGYRYYEEEQVSDFYKIKQLQTAGFTLNEIKQIISEKNILKLEKQIVKIKEETTKKIEILQDILKTSKKENSCNIEFISNPVFYTVGNFYIIKNNKDLFKRKKEYSYIDNYPKVFINYNKYYQENDFLCFIGNIVPKEVYKKEISDKVRFNNSMVKSLLHAKVIDSVISTYQEIIQFANQNHIQIRGEFYEITNNNDTDVYVEAYDLLTENIDTIRHYEHVAETIQDIFPKEFIGCWKLQGEIIEPYFMIDYNRPHPMPDTNLVELELHKDGSTNFPFITWKDKYLLVNYNNKIIYNPIYLTKDKKYLELLYNMDYSNSRPYIYYYSKIK